MGEDRKYGHLGEDTGPGKAIPGDEPVFILRAQDKASVKAILAYAESAYEQGASQQFVDDVIASMRRFRAWQETNGSKTPD